MRYVEFRESIQTALRRHSAGLTWAQLKTRFRLPYERACPTWTKRLENEIGLTRTPGAGRALVWRIGPGPRSRA